MSSLEEGYCSFPDECVLFGLDALSSKTHDIWSAIFYFCCLSRQHDGLTSLWSQTDLVQTLPLPVHSCVTLGKQLNLSVPEFPNLKFFFKYEDSNSKYIRELLRRIQEVFT